MKTIVDFDLKPQNGNLFSLIFLLCMTLTICRNIRVMFFHFPIYSLCVSSRENRNRFSLNKINPQNFSVRLAQV